MSYNLNNEILKRATKSIYKDDGKVIKLFVPGYSKSAVLNEALNHSRVEEFTDLNVPKFLEVTTIDGRWAVVMEYTEGKTLRQLMEENPNKQDEYLNLFVDLQLEVLSKKVPLLTMLTDKFKRKLDEAKCLDENEKFELMHRLDGFKRHTKLCHGDFNPANIIIDEKGKAHIIDWAHATQGNASADAARTFLIFSIAGENTLAEKYLDLFSEKSGIDKSNIHRWIPIVAAIELEKGNPEEQEMLKKWVSVVEPF